MLDRLRSILEARLSTLLASQHTRPDVKLAANEKDVRELRASGNRCLAEGRFAEAEVLFRQALHLNSVDTDTLTCLGFALKELGLYAEAREQLGRTVALLGNVTEAYEATYLLGQISEIDGAPLGAKVQYLKVLKLKPDFMLACNDLLRIYQQTGQQDQIPALLRQCTAACPEILEYGYLYGHWLVELKHHEAAVDELGRVIQIKPDYAEARNNRGIALHALGRLDEALEDFNLAIQLRPDLVQAYSNRGSIFLRRKQFDAAMADFNTSILLSPTTGIPHINMGEALRETRQLAAAIAHYDKAIELNPADPIPYWNKALALLLGGSFLEGFALYDYRYNDPPPDSQRDFSKARWQGTAPLEGKTILLHCDQGLGDTIQFCRYAPLLASLGATVILEVHRSLVRLLQGLEGVAQIVERGHPLPPFDLHSPIMSLPHAFSTEQHSIPLRDSYLSTEAAQQAKWVKRLGGRSKPQVGIVWSGNALHKNDHNRSLALSELLDVLPQGYRYISLQKEIRPADQITMGNSPWIEHFGDLLEDFTDTAALCEQMDLVISVDTSVAHLAAALGKPTWILLPYSVDWRWMLDRSDSPWYSSVKLYRQEKVDDWYEALQCVATDLPGFLDPQAGSMHIAKTSRGE